MLLCGTGPQDGMRTSSPPHITAQPSSHPLPVRGGCSLQPPARLPRKPCPDRRRRHHNSAETRWHLTAEELRGPNAQRLRSRTPRAANKQRPERSAGRRGAESRSRQSGGGKQQPNTALRRREGRDGRRTTQPQPTRAGTAERTEIEAQRAPRCAAPRGTCTAAAQPPLRHSPSPSARDIGPLPPTGPGVLREGRGGERRGAERRCPLAPRAGRGCVRGWAGRCVGRCSSCSVRGIASCDPGSRQGCAPSAQTRLCGHSRVKAPQTHTSQHPALRGWVVTNNSPSSLRSAARFAPGLSRRQWARSHGAAFTPHV